MKYTQNLAKLSLKDIIQAGGKGASLGKMIQAGIPVPPGFVVLSSAFDQFLEKTNLNVEIDTLLHEVDTNVIHTGEKVSTRIQALIKSTQMPKDIAKEIEKAFEELHAEHVAVRSSATAEDSSSAAWAGQLDSFLNTTQDTLLEKVQACWASLFTPRAIFYRFEKELHTQKISVAVVVQKMVQAEASGVVFSVHPVTQNTNTLLIEAGLGLGEAVVQGIITPDTYIVQKKPWQIVNTTRGVLSKGKQTLSQQQILQLSSLILQVESLFELPVDVEWAFENNTFYITQSRPITTLEKWQQSRYQFPDMVLVGTRRTNQFEASLRARAWSNELEKVIGYGFKIVVINSDGEHYVDRKSSNKINTILQKKGPERALKHIENMYAIRERLLENMRNDTGIDLTEMFIRLFTEFFVARRIAEYTYEKATKKLQKQIGKWRNDATLFEPLDLFYTYFPQENSSDNWSVVATEGQVNTIPEKLSWQQSEADKNTQSTKIVTGSSAWKGNVHGIVKVVFEKAQMDKVQKGDILVSPMTTPDFLPAMKKAAALVTDEGGITSHAAIVAREMKKPCVVGTKVASRVLQDGDEVEVDADQGIIRILNKAN